MKGALHIKNNLDKLIIFDQSATNLFIKQELTKLLLASIIHTLF